MSLCAKQKEISFMSGTTNWRTTGYVQTSFWEAAAPRGRMHPCVAQGDVATIYGTDGLHSHPADLVARSIGTVTSDLLCAISSRDYRH
jgi:hypothetical protein